MRTQACMFHICFLLALNLNYRHAFLLHHCETTILPILYISNQGTSCEMGCCSREPFFWDPLEVVQESGWLSQWIAVGRSRVTVGQASLGGLFLHLGSQTPSQRWERFEFTHPLQRTWWKQILQKPTETIGRAQFGLLWFRVRMMSLLLSRCHSEIAMRMQQPTANLQTFLPPSKTTSLTYLFPLTSALLERSHRHCSILPQAALATRLNPSVVGWFWSVCLLVLELQAHFRVSRS